MHHLNPHENSLRWESPPCFQRSRLRVPEVKKRVQYNLRSKKSIRICPTPQPVARALLPGRLSPVASHISLLFFFTAVTAPVSAGYIPVCFCFLSVCPECNPLGTERQFTLSLLFPWLEEEAPGTWGPSVSAAGRTGRAAPSAPPCCCQEWPSLDLLLSFFPLRNAQPPFHEHQTPTSEDKEKQHKDGKWCRVTKPMHHNYELWSPEAAATEPACPRAYALQQDTSPQREAHTPQLQSSP